MTIIALHARPLSCVVVIRSQADAPYITANSEHEQVSQHDKYTGTYADRSVSLSVCLTVSVFSRSWQCQCYES